MKKNKGFIIFCIFLLLIIAVLAIYILTNKDLYKNNENDVIITEKEFSIKNAELLLEEFGFNLRHGCETIIQSEYNDTFKALVAISKLEESKIYEEDCSIYYTEKTTLNGKEAYKGEYGYCIDKAKVVTYSDVNSIYKKLYNEELPTKSINSLDVNSMYYEAYNFIPEKDVFVKAKIYGAGGTCTSNHIRKIINAKESNNTIVINLYDFESEYIEIENNIYKFKTNSFETEINCKNIEECMKIVETKYLDKLDKYKVDFEKINNNYVFKNIIKITN